MKVVILGASDNIERYSNKAQKLLLKFGHEPILVNPKLSSIEGISCYKNLTEVTAKEKNIDTLTLYVNPEVSTSLTNEIIKLKPRRVIFNPGSENKKLMDELTKQKIEVEEACTLVLLNTHQF
ncbi:MAG: CoA-binding protein [Bacteriovoracaceae bacterium]